MRYSKLLTTVAVLLAFLQQTAYAENWQSADCNGKTVYIDVDSIKNTDDEVFYNVKYYEPSVSEDVVVTIESYKNRAGVVKTYKYSEYVKNSQLKTISTGSFAKEMKVLNSTSPLYKANFIAQNYNKPSRPQQNSLSQTQTSSEVDFGPYMRELQRRIKMNWDPPKGDENKRIVLLIKIAKDGRLLSCSVLKSSGIPNADKAAINAVHLASPYRSLPSGYKGTSIDIQFTFDYNVFGANKY